MLIIQISILARSGSELAAVGRQQILGRSPLIQQGKGEVYPIQFELSSRMTFGWLRREGTGWPGESRFVFSDPVVETPMGWARKDSGIFDKKQDEKRQNHLHGHRSRSPFSPASELADAARRPRCRAPPDGSGSHFY